MIHINLHNYKPSDKWLKKSDEYTAEMIQHAKNDEFKEVFAVIGAHAAHWGKLKEKLLEYSYGKCWFSEARELYSYYQVEHFRPKAKCIEIDDSEKDGYWSLAFDWHNYRICGGVGNVHKGNHFAVKRNKVTQQPDSIDDEVIYLLDPLKKEDVRQLTFNENGEAKPSNPKPTDWNCQRAEYTIKYLKLNYEPLVEERRRIWGEMSDLIEEINAAEEDCNANPSATNEQKKESLKDKAREYIAPCKELSSTYRACLRACGEGWAKDILEEQIDIKKYCKQYIK